MDIRWASLYQYMLKESAVSKTPVYEIYVF